MRNENTWGRWHVLAIAERQHNALHLSKATAKSTHAAACAELLNALPRLPEGKGYLNMTKERGNHEYLFSPLADADSPANFMLKLQPWLQVVLAGLEEEKAKQEQEVVVAEHAAVGSVIEERENKVRRGREGEGKDGTEELEHTAKCRRVVVTKELDQGAPKHAEEEMRFREADGNGQKRVISSSFGDCDRSAKRHAFISSKSAELHAHSSPKSARVHAHSSPKSARVHAHTSPKTSVDPALKAMKID